MTTQPIIRFDRWQPISVASLTDLFQNAPFSWCLAGGYAVEQFLGRLLRPHGDIDLVAFRDEQLALQDWLKGWQLYAAHKPGALRKWQPDEYLPYGIHDIWGHQKDSMAWQLQIMLQEVEGDRWFCRRNHAVGGLREEFVRHYNQIPCIRIDIQLMYKAKNIRQKDAIDFAACLPKLSSTQRSWLKNSLSTMFPQGHEWLSILENP